MILSNLSLDQKIRPNFVIFASFIPANLEGTWPTCSAENHSLEEVFLEILKKLTLGVWVDSKLNRENIVLSQKVVSLVILDPHQVEEFSKQYTTFQRVGVIIRRQEIRYE